MPLGRTRLPRALVTLLLTSATAVGVGLGSTTAYADTVVPIAPTATSVTIYGEGNGHGHGMSQYGANAAAKRGLSTDQILRHYYPGTAHGAARGQIRVLISTRPSLVVGTRKGLVASVVGGRSWRLTHLANRSARKAKRWSITPVSATRSRLSYRKAGRWHSFRVVTGQIQFRAAGSAPIRLFAGSDSGTFRGTLRSARSVATSADRDIVNIVPLESYVKGVVPNEMPALWAPAAVRAQAIAARTYAVHQRTTPESSYYDVLDSTRSQVYRGAGSERRASNRAVDATKRRILTYGGRPAFTQFSSSNGGYMLANSAFPYLVSGRDVYDPVRTWTKTVSMSALKGRFLSRYELGSITIRTFPKAGGWVDRVIFTSKDGLHSNNVPGDTFKSWAGLKSASFRFTK